MSTTSTPLASVFDSEAVEEVRKRHRLDPEQIRRFRTSFCKNFCGDAWIRKEFSWTEELTLHPLRLYQRLDSQLDGATKLVFQTSTGLLIESVILRIDTGRTTLCLSSQVGCAAACDFCATGKMGVAIDLSAAEILDQVVLAGQLLAEEGRNVRNLVFMGMGEPFHNEAQVMVALKKLLSPDYFYHPAKKILVSSVGVADAMIRCARTFPEVGLALSLHSVRQRVRAELIPLAAKYSLDDLRETIKTVNQIQSNPVMIEYLMLAGVNDSLDDAVLLIDWLRRLRVHVNLIPYNPIEDSQLVGSEPSVIEAFARELKQASYKTTTRYSLGNDIGAACGQLIQETNRDLAREISRQRLVKSE